MKITKKMTFAQILTKHPEAVAVFVEKGMHCFGCPASAMESLEDGAKAHGLNADELVKELNKKLGGKNAKTNNK